MEKVYFITDGMYIKIGTTKVGVEKRLKQLNTGSPKKLYLLGYISGGKEKEKEIHKQFNNNKIRQNGEWFQATDELISFINKVNEKQNIIVIKNELLNNFLMATTKI